MTWGAASGGIPLDPLHSDYHFYNKRVIYSTFTSEYSLIYQHHIIRMALSRRD